MTSLELTVSRFVEHKRALGRKYKSEEAELRLLVRYAEAHDASQLEQLTPVLLDDFLASRPRPRPRGFNHLLGVVRRLLDAAAALPDCTQAPHRGATYRTIFALCYGLGLRVGEASALRVGDVDLARSLLVVTRAKFGKSRLVPHGPRIGELVAQQLKRRSDGARLDDDAPLFTFDGHRSVHPRSVSVTFHRLVLALGFTAPPGVSPPVLHSLRHTLASRALVAGEVAFLLGHRDATVTRTVYVREVADARRRAMRRSRMVAEYGGVLQAAADPE